MLGSQRQSSMVASKIVAFILIINLSFIVSCTISNEPGPADEGKAAAKVVRVIDGDTVEVTWSGGTESVRLIGIDTPETVHPTKGIQAYGKEASDFTKKQLTDKDVRIEFDVEKRDQYGRLLAYVWLDGTMFNKTLVSNGYAQVSTYPPNVKYVEVFTQAQKVARENEKGIWGLE